MPRDPVTGRRRCTTRQIEGSRRDAEVALARPKVAHEGAPAPEPRNDSSHHPRRVRRIPGSGRLRPGRTCPENDRDDAVGGKHHVVDPITGRSGVRHDAAEVLELADDRGALWRNEGSRFGTDWIRRCATVLSRALDLARKRGFIESNPAKDAVRPKSTRTKPFAPTASDVRDALARVRFVDEELADAVTVLAGTGMRKAELLGLQWGDGSLDRDEILVTAAMTDAGPGRKIIRKPTKQSDWREVPRGGRFSSSLIFTPTQRLGTRHVRVRRRVRLRLEYLRASTWGSR